MPFGPLVIVINMGWTKGWASGGLGDSEYFNIDVRYGK